MWHHLPSEGARRLLFAEFALDRRVVGLLDAIAIGASRRRPEMLPRALIPAEVQGAPSFYSSLEPALMLALSAALGKMAPVAVLNAWKQAFRSLTERLAA